MGVRCRFTLAVFAFFRFLFFIFIYKYRCVLWGGASVCRNRGKSWRSIIDLGGSSSLLIFFLARRLLPLCRFLARLFFLASCGSGLFGCPICLQAPITSGMHGWMRGWHAFICAGGGFHPSL